MILVFKEGADGLAQLQDVLNQFQTSPVDVDTPEVTPVDLVEDEDLRLIVQMRLADKVELIPGFTMQKWVDTNIDADDLDYYRADFPEQEYRLVAVYDEIVDEFDSVDQQLELTPEDEIGLLKAEILSLKAQLANADKQEF